MYSMTLFLNLALERFFRFETIMINVLLEFLFRVQWNYDYDQSNAKQRNSRAVYIIYCFISFTNSSQTFNKFQEYHVKVSIVDPSINCLVCCSAWFFVWFGWFWRGLWKNLKSVLDVIRKNKKDPSFFTKLSMNPMSHRKCYWFEISNQKTVITYSHFDIIYIYSKLYIYMFLYFHEIITIKLPYECV